MSDKDLLGLYLKQKHYRLFITPSIPFVKAVLPVYNAAKISKLNAPALKQFQYQVEVPCILFQPPNPNGTLLVHVHGGPKAYINTKSYHAEITHYLSKGNTILCPNHRGSTGYGSEHEEVAKDKLPTYAVQDVYAASVYFCGMQGINKIILRGGSYGSCVNAHLLSLIGRGVLKNIFAGVHLMGGCQYPSPQHIPHDIPIFIAHGKLDEICPFELAADFMLQLLESGHKNVQTFIAPNGDHHMMSKDLSGDDLLQRNPAREKEYEEIGRYLARSTLFIKNIHD